MINNGEIRTSTNGFTVFFGSVSGAGTFTGTGTVNFEGDLNPGSSPVSIPFAGDVAFGTAATLRIQLGGATAGSEYDQIVVTGNFALDGTLAVSLINNFTPAAGQTFNILDWLGTRTGTFSSITLPTLAGLTWNTSQLYTAGVLSLVAAALPGDYNHDDIVDAADYVLWRKGLVTAFTLNDYNVWRANFDSTACRGLCRVA